MRVVGSFIWGQKGMKKVTTGVRVVKYPKIKPCLWMSWMRLMRSSKNKYQKLINGEPERSKKNECFEFDLDCAIVGCFWICPLCVAVCESIGGQIVIYILKICCSQLRSEKVQNITFNKLSMVAETLCNLLSGNSIDTSWYICCFATEKTIIC